MSSITEQKKKKFIQKRPLLILLLWKQCAELFDAVIYVESSSSLN